MNTEEPKQSDPTEEVKEEDTDTSEGTSEVTAESSDSATEAASESSDPQEAATEELTPEEQPAPVADAEAEPAAAEAAAPEEDERYKWYVVRTYSGYEQKAKLALQERIRQAGMQDRFRDVLIPSENVIELVRGEKKTTSRKFFPGYILVKMDLDENAWHLVKGTPKVTGFVGNAVNPPAVPEEEVAKIATQMQEGTLKPRPKVQFEEGESVRVIDGPFVNFNGVVEEVKPDKGKLRVMVSIFGRSTPVELDFVQVEKN